MTDLPEYGVVPCVLVDPTPVVGVDTWKIVCQCLVISRNSDGTYISVAFPHIFDAEKILNTVRDLSLDARRALAVLGEDWHGNLEDLINAAKELA